ncbi:MAG: 3-hydroxyacyl-CoA dehydrogenase [Euryarchaeota archaeon]|nr:3-hydroxyacyl-CoA dehydrogenase [Euryarchaeota archaeon]
MLTRRVMPNIERVAIIGAGNMGSGIAQKSSQENFEVEMIDIEKKWVDNGLKTIDNFLEEAQERRIFSPSQVKSIKNRITGKVGTENISSDVDLVIEAVFEDLSVKTNVFTTLDKVCNSDTILASNTSSLSINDLASHVARPDRFVGLHFFYHPAKNRLIEIIPAKETSPDTLSSVEQYCKMMGKVIIICKDRPGFVVNRFFVPWLTESCRLVEEGIGTPSQIDYVARETFQIGLGPFALMNLTGSPIALHSTEYLAKQLGVERFQAPNNLKEIVNDGNDWQVELDSDCDEKSANIIRERLLGQIFTVASQIVEEEICSLEDVDRGAKIGLRWSKGPFELANEFGIQESIRMAKNYCELSDLVLPRWFANLDSKIPISYVDVAIKNRIAYVKINRPEAMNALNLELVDQLEKTILSLNNNNEIDTIVIEGAGKSFVSGADVKFFVDKIRENSIIDIINFTDKGHSLLSLIENSTKTTIAITTGVTLGGGFELALACDYRIGTPTSKFRFPETSIGIYPGFGGTQRTVRISGIECARYAALAGNFLDSETTKSFGLLTHVTQPTGMNEIIENLSNSGKNKNKYPGKPNDLTNSSVKFAMEFYSEDNMDKIFRGEFNDIIVQDEKLKSLQIKNLSRCAPIALKKCDELLQIAVETGDELALGLKAELDALEGIFSTNDALEGLSSLIEARRPEYSSS